jgi:hypothetical protein
MRNLNRNCPNANAIEMLKTWDENEAAKAAFSSQPANDFLSHFCAFADIADYG